MKVALDFEAYTAPQSRFICGETSLQEKVRVLRLMMKIFGRAIGRESLLPANMKNQSLSLITKGAGPVRALDKRSIFTTPHAVWHHLMCLRASGEERWAQRQTTHHAKQQATRKRAAASGNSLHPKPPMQ